MNTKLITDRFNALIRALFRYLPLHLNMNKHAPSVPS